VDLWSRIPEFHYAAPSTVWVLGQQRLAIAVLLTWAALATMGARWAVRRASVA
jgi:hypothetical protein